MSRFIKRIMSTNITLKSRLRDTAAISPMIGTMKNLTIDPERLWDELMETARIGATPKGGICRPTLTELDRQVRDWLSTRAEGLGCTVTVDDMGNMFARRLGQRSDLPPIAMGSHLDTQPTGGKFDHSGGIFFRTGNALRLEVPLNA